MDGIKQEDLALKWENHQRTIVAALGSLLKNGTFTDCTLAAEGKFIQAHRFVLSACSPYFSDIFSQKCDKHPIVVLHNIKFEELRAMLDYMYNGEVNVVHDQLSALMKAAESLQIKGLSKGRSESNQCDDDRQRQDTDFIEDDVTNGQENIPLQVNCENHTQQENVQQAEQLQESCSSKGILRSKKYDTEYESFGRQKRKIQIQRKSNVDATRSTSVNRPFKTATMSQSVSAESVTDFSSKRSFRSTSLYVPKTSYEDDISCDGSSEPEQKRRHAATNFRADSESVGQLNNSAYVATELVKNKRGTDILICNGFEFAKNSAGQKATYWRCKNYKKGCKATAQTKLINGACMMAIVEPNHNHEKER